MTKRYLLIILIIFFGLLLAISLSYAKNEYSKRFIVIITDSRIGSVRQTSFDIRAKLLNMRKNREFDNFANLNEINYTFDYKDNDQKKALDEVGFKQTNLPALAVVLLDKYNRPKKILWSTKITDIDDATWGLMSYFQNKDPNRFKTFVHAPGGNWNLAHDDYVIQYVTPAGEKYLAKLKRNTFIHAPDGDWSRSHEDNVIAYVTWNGQSWLAKINGYTFTHAPNGAWNWAHKDTVIQYKTWNGQDWLAKIKLFDPKQE